MKGREKKRRREGGEGNASTEEWDYLAEGSGG